MNQFYCWACDISKNSGEGNLAHLFIKNLSANCIIYTPYKLNINNRNFNRVINYKYISPLIGILFCWFFFFKKKKIIFFFFFFF